MMGRDAVGRDRGQKGEQRRDIRVFVDSQGGLSVGSTVELTEDQARYLSECQHRRRSDVEGRKALRSSVT